MKNAESRCHPDELRDQRQPIRQDQVRQGEPAPERPECIENSFRVAPLGDRAQPHGHFLDDVGHGAQDDQEPQEAVPVPGSRGRVCRYAAGVVVRDHDDHSGPVTVRKIANHFHPRRRV